MNAHHGLLKVPLTLVSAYLRLHDKTDEEIDQVDLKSIKGHNHLAAYNNPWTNRQVNRDVLKPDTTGDKWWLYVPSEATASQKETCLHESG